MAESKQGTAQRKGRSETPVRGEAAPAVTASLGQDAELDALREKLVAARGEIGLRKAPFKAIRLALLWLSDFAIRTISAVLRSPLTWFLVVPLVAGWCAAKYNLAPELFMPPVCGEREPGLLWNVELALKEVAWWVILGILSSVGFGTGLHSGIMFLFPHVMQVVGAAEGCGTTTGLVSWYQHPCKLDCHTTSGPKDGSTITVFRLWSLVSAQCMLWGIGTAIGELPPYLVSRAARLGGSKDSDYHAEIDEAREKSDLFSKMKIWTIDFTQKHGFLGVFLLASWPNAAFDMCGMCCGYVLMPFWTFFIATCLGKGVVKVNAQAVAFVVLFGSAAFQVLLSGVDKLNHFLAGIVGQDLGLRHLLEKGRAKLVRQFEQQSRFPPAKLFSGGKPHLDLEGIRQVYSKHDDSHAVAGRVLQEWDTNGDGRLTPAELGLAASRTDGKISLSSLDPGTGTSPLKMLWELFIVGLVLFFLFSVVDQLARTKQQELDDEELEKFAKEKEKRK